MGPQGPRAIRAVNIGGLSKSALLAAMEQHGVRLNDAGRELFAHPGFTTCEAPSVVETVELSVADLGFPDGATIERIFAQAARLGLAPCPLEVGPHLRLQFLDQPEGHLGQPPSQHRAPPGSLTIASAPCAPADDDVPRGFYLRRIEGVLWLRGYRSGPDHVWRGEDRFILAGPGGGQRAIVG